MGDKEAKKDLKPLRSWICSHQAKCYNVLKEYAKALPKGEQAVDEDPNLAYAWCVLGDCQFCVDRFDEGIVNYETAIQ